MVERSACSVFFSAGLVIKLLNTEATPTISTPPARILIRLPFKVLAPSSGAQYRRARKALLRFNEKPLLPKTSQDEILTGVLRDIANNMDAVMADIERHVREHSSDWMDNSADNVFYYNQGRLYGYYVVLKALAEDFEPLILAADQYEHWTALVKSLESGVQLDPFVVRNGMPDSGSAPNHLLALGYYAAKADLLLNKIILNLQEKDNAH